MIEENILLAILVSAIATYLCRFFGVLFSKKLKIDSWLFDWIKCISIGIIVAVISKIIFFPEGRIGNGVKIKKFHSKLFNSIAHTKSNLQSIFIRYPVDYPSDKSSDDSVCWADKSQTLLKISLRCLSRKNTIVVLCFGEVINTSMSDAYELAKKSTNSVSSSLSQL